MSYRGAVDENTPPLLVFQQGRRRQQTLHLRLADSRNIQKIFFAAHACFVVSSPLCPFDVKSTPPVR